MNGRMEIPTRYSLVNRVIYRPCASCSLQSEGIDFRGPAQLYLKKLVSRSPFLLLRGGGEGGKNARDRKLVDLEASRGNEGLLFVRGGRDLNFRNLLAFQVIPQKNKRKEKISLRHAPFVIPKARCTYVCTYLTFRADSREMIVFGGARERGNIPLKLNTVYE